MSALATKLAALRRQAGVTTSSATMISPASRLVSEPSHVRNLPASISIDALRRLLGVRERHTPANFVRDGSLPGIEIAAGLRLIEQILPWLDAPTAIDASFAQFGAIPRGDLLHIDTETTGLSGGTGTRAFMIGAAQWTDRGLHLRQLLLTTMAGEATMLSTFAQWIRPQHVLVSYNGRCYDAPLLATRYRLARQSNPLSGLGHLDLLFPVRRRYRGVFENCRLATIEREVLGVLREDDLPGSQAPAAWREYLQRGEAGNLRRVLAHNQQDLVSLARLLLKMGEVA